MLALFSKLLYTINMQRELAAQYELERFLEEFCFQLTWEETKQEFSKVQIFFMRRSFDLKALKYYIFFR